MVNNNLLDIQNKILQILKDIEKLNMEYKSLVNELDKFSNSKKIDELESEIYDLESMLLANHTDSSYFFQVVDYKKWLIKNGSYVDNVDFLNKKINLSNILNERVAMLQANDNNDKYIKESQLIYEQQELEYQKQQEELEYQRQIQEYEQQQELEYQRQMQEYKQQMQEYEQQLQQQQLQ